MSFTVHLEALTSGMKAKLDTNGSFPQLLQELIADGLVDFVALDVKAPLDRYADAAGVAIDTEALLESIALLRESGCGHLFRTTVVPGLLQSEDIEAIAAMLGAVEEYRLQPFAAGETLDPAYADRPSCSGEELSRLAGVARRFIRRVTVEGK